MSLSVCIITRDNEKTIERCLKSVAPVADQIVVVDTGSFDGTIDIARRYTNCVHTHPWNHDFSKSRNHSLDYATGDWILWMDSDDELTKESIPALTILKERKLDMAFYFTVYNKGDYDINIVQTKRFEQLRMFRNILGVRFEGRVHEVPTKSLKVFHQTLAKVPEEEISINHYGYDDPKAVQQKLFRNHRIRLFEGGIPDDLIFLEFKIEEYFFFYTPNFLAAFKAMRFAGHIDTEPGIMPDELFKEAKRMVSYYNSSRYYSDLVDVAVRSLNPGVGEKSLSDKMGEEINRIAVLSANL